MAPSGRIDAIEFWCPGMPDWQSLDLGAPELYVGTDIHLRVPWLNTGSLRSVGRVELGITFPDNSTIIPAAISGQDLAALPFTGWYVEFSSVVLDQVGTYTTTVTLSMEETAEPPGPAELRIDDLYFAYNVDNNQNVPGDEKPTDEIAYAETNRFVSFWIKVHNYAICGGETGSMVLYVLSIASQRMDFSVPPGESRWCQVMAKYMEPGVCEYAVYVDRPIALNLLFTALLTVA